MALNTALLGGFLAQAVIILGQESPISSGLASANQTGPDSSQVYGCEDVDCPNVRTSTTDSSCHVGEDDLGAVGIATYHSGLLDTSLTWTLGIGVSNDSDDYTVERSFYLGTDPDFSPDDFTQGWALFLLENDGRGNHTLFAPHHLGDWNGTNCQQDGGLSSGCLSNLNNAITTTILSSETEDISTSALSADLNSNDFSSCRLESADISSNASLVIHVAPLTGSSAFKPLSGDRNSSSDCWPTLPKSNSLTDVFSFDIDARNIDEVDIASAGLTPLITVWTRKSTIEFHAMCFQPPYFTTQGLDNINDGNGGNAAASVGALSKFWTLALGFAIGLVAMS